MDTARLTSPCNPTFKRPHYQAVGLEDTYAGETSGVYNSRTLWLRYSTDVLACSGGPNTLAAGSAYADVHSNAVCSQYTSCSQMAAPQLNVYCAVSGMGHETRDHHTLVTRAFNDFFAR